VYTSAKILRLKLPQCFLTEKEIMKENKKEYSVGCGMRRDKIPRAPWAIEALKNAAKSA
jgi:hypothetical protein